MINTLYPKIKAYIKSHHGFSRDFFNTPLYQEVLKLKEKIKEKFNNKKVKVKYVYFQDFFSKEGVVVGKLVFDENNNMKLYEGRNRSRFYYLTLGLYEGFQSTLVIKEITPISSEEFKRYLEEKKKKELKNKYEWW